MPIPFPCELAVITWSEQSKLNKGEDPSFPSPLLPSQPAFINHYTESSEKISKYFCIIPRPKK